jgi:hypothetical protein
MLCSRILFCTFLLLPFVLGETELSSTLIKPQVNSDPFEVAHSKIRSRTVLPLRNGSSIEPIEFSDIIKDLSSLSKPEEGDLSTAAANNPKRKIVGIKKHKNYEIVLYEYSDEEGLHLGPAVDFDSLTRPDEESGRVETAQSSARKKNSKHAS